jgi:hypothetical protein
MTGSSSDAQGVAVRVLAEAEAAWAPRFGTGSRRELGARLAEALERAGARVGDSAHGLRPAVEREHVARYGERALEREASDERARDAAAVCDSALLHYEGKWRAALERLLRVHPARWAVSGLSDGEVSDELTLRLMETVRSGSAARLCRARAGKEWGLLFLAAERRQLRRSFRLKVVLADTTPVLDGGLTGEECLIERETATCYELARARGERGLSRPQRRWFAALCESANSGAFFATSGNPNLAAASRLNGKHRSSALRAYRELERHFTRELARIAR